MLWLCLSMSPWRISIYGETKIKICRNMASQEVGLANVQERRFKWHNVHYPCIIIAKRDGCNPSVACSWVYRNMYKIVSNSPTIVSNFVDGETAEPGETFCTSKMLPTLMSLLTCDLHHTCSYIDPKKSMSSPHTRVKVIIPTTGWFRFRSTTNMGPL